MTKSPTHSPYLPLYTAKFKNTITIADVLKRYGFSFFAWYYPILRLLQCFRISFSFVFVSLRASWWAQSIAFSVSCCCYKSFLSILLSIFPLSNMRYTKPVPFFTFQKVIHSTTAQYTSIACILSIFFNVCRNNVLLHLYIFSTFNNNEIYLRGVNIEHIRFDFILYAVLFYVLRLHGFNMLCGNLLYMKMYLWIYILYDWIEKHMEHSNISSYKRDDDLDMLRLEWKWKTCVADTKAKLVK